MRFVGVVKKGSGAAEADVARGIYTEAVGDCYPGTLNLSVPEGLADLLGPPARSIPYGKRHLRLWPATIEPIGQVWLMIPHDVDGTVEILAYCHLRTDLGVNDGDEVAFVSHVWYTSYVERCASWS